jgi:hypothetical protein
MKLFTIEPLDVWLMKLKGKERPFDEYPRSVRRTLTRIKQMAFQPAIVIRYNSKLQTSTTVDIDWNQEQAVAWLSANASGMFFHEVKGNRIYLADDDDAVLFKLIFSEQV